METSTKDKLITIVENINDIQMFFDLQLNLEIEAVEVLCQDNQEELKSLIYMKILQLSNGQIHYKP